MRANLDLGKWEGRDAQEWDRQRDYRGPEGRWRSGMNTCLCLAKTRGRGGECMHSSNESRSPAHLNEILLHFGLGIPVISVAQPKKHANFVLLSDLCELLRNLKRLEFNSEN